MQLNNAAELASGRWHGILTALGVPQEFLTGKHGPCPICGGKDRFRFDNKNGRGTWICNQCGSGDGYKMLEAFHGWGFKHALEEVKSVVGIVQPEQSKDEQTEAKKIAALRKTWEESKPVTKGDPVWNYLKSRGVITTFVPSVIRYHPALTYRNGNVTTKHPAMVAAVTYPDQKCASIHRTYLTLDGKKANVESPKKLMPGRTLKGVSIKLGKPDDVLGVAEGIETALAAMMRFGFPVWSCVSSSILAGFEPPKEVRKIVVFSDNDHKFGGQAAAYSLAHRLAVSGYEVEVRVPTVEGTDWADYGI